jgi:hypothetical protein
LQAALQAFDRFAMRAPWLQALEDTVAWAVQRGSTEMALAAALAGAAEQGRAAAGLAQSPRAHRAWLALVDALRQAIGSAAFELALQDGRTWDRRQAHHVALSTLARS